MEAEWFENWFGSPWYAILYKDRDVSEAQHFAQNLLQHLQPASHASMLDIACGEGRLSIELAHRGYSVTGLDLSQLSIGRALRHDAENLHFYVHDMREPFRINYFDYAFSFFTSFGYFATTHDNMRAAKSFASGLKPGGTLVLDYLNRDYILDRWNPLQTVVKGDYTFHIHKEYKDGFFLKNIRVPDADGKARAFQERVAAFSKDDLVSLFTEAGLQHAETFGSYQLDDYHEKHSPRLILTFKKA